VSVFCLFTLGRHGNFTAGVTLLFVYTRSSR